MYLHLQRPILASMSEIDSPADMPLLSWSDLVVTELLLTGTVTLLLADVESLTRLRETQPDEMTLALAWLDQTLAHLAALYDGVVQQGEGASFVVGFARASDAVGCALDLQRAPLEPVTLRIALHTGEVRLRDDGKYVGSTIKRAGQLRDQVHGGQTLLSASTESLVIGHLPAGAWLSDLGMYPVRDLPRPERIIQLCHSGLRNDFPPLRTPNTVVPHNLPEQFTSFVGRQAEMDNIRSALVVNRLVTLTGAGGVGKTRLALQVATQLGPAFEDGGVVRRPGTDYPS
jgi:class 3 adenylate cyclase